MAVSKSAARMDYWREYFRTANASIFEIIEGAIMMAASDYPKEFRIRRDSIAQTLFSCKLINCSGCDKEELALLDVYYEEHEDRDDHDDHEEVKYKSKLVDVDANGSKGSSKVINSCRNDDDDDELHMNNHQVSNYSYGDAEALTDEIEEESQMFDEVMRIKEIVDNSPDESASVLCNSLRKLQLMSLSVETLKATEIGKSVNSLRKHSSKVVRQIAKTLIEVWKDMVDEWVRATTKITVSEATPESMNPSVLDEEDGLPSPPMDDLAFLNPHTISLELNQFFDGVDDYGNPGKSLELNKNPNNVRNPRVEKLKEQHKPFTTELVKKQSNVVKTNKPPVADSGPGRRMKLNNMDRKLQNSEKATLQKRPVAPQHKPTTSDEKTVQVKLEATKRKLHERYQQAENAKRQRTIQVMELHDLPKPKNQHARPGNNHNRHWPNGRFE